MPALTTIPAFVLLFLMTAAQAQPPWAGEMLWERAAQDRQLGVLVEELPLSRLDALQLPYGVRISRVFPGSPAQAGGLQSGDIISEVGGQAVFSVSRLRWLVAKSAPQDTLTIKYHRDGRAASTDIHLGSAPPEQPPAAVWRTERSWSSPGYLGVALQPLTPGLREAFSVPAGAGVLIAEVYADTPASKSGLGAGDVIVRMDRRTIREIADVQRVLDYFEPGEGLAIEVIRDGNSLEFDVTLGERDRSSGREPGRDWLEPRGEMQPLFDPAWWEQVEELVERWRDYFQQRRTAPPPVAL